MKKRFLNFSVLLCFVFSVFLVGSCQKKDETPAQTQQEDASTSLNEVGDAEPTPDLGSGLSGVAIEFSRMIVQDATAYRHFYQKSAITCGGDVCLATSYMMGRGIIYPSKPFSAQELDRIRIGMRTSCPGGASITNGYSFARTDIGSCQPTNEWTDRETAKNNIRKWLASGLPVISLVRITAGSQITASGRFNHFVLIVGLDYTVGGVGSVVYFIDPLSRVAQIRQANYTNFLNAMSAASSTGRYNFMPVGCEKDALPVVTPTQTRIIQLSGDLNFGTVNVGQSSVPKTLTIRNTGNSPLTVSGLTLPAGFIGNFSGTVAANSSQTVNITFTPTAQGSFNVYGAVNANQTSGTIDFPLYGIAIQNQPPNDNLNTGLVLNLPFNGNANDVSGNGNNGIVNGATLTTDRRGNANSAYSFNGAGNYIKVNLSSTNIKNDYTISYWVSFANFNADYPHIFNGENNYLTSHGLGTGYGNDKGKVTFYQESTESVGRPWLRMIEPINTSKLNENVFYHITIIKNSSTCSIYMNGSKVTSTSVNNRTVVNGNYITLGSRINDIPTGLTPEQFYLNGKIDEFRVYNRALTEQEVSRLSQQ